LRRAWLGLGSDLGDRLGWLKTGVERLRCEGLRPGAISPLYLTEPVGDSSIPWFLNCALELRAPPAPGELLERCLRVERLCGRRRSGDRIEARTLDIDILLYDRLRLAEPGLTLPHPRLHERRFALRPLADIAPEAIHPEAGRSVAELLDELESTERVWLLAPFPAAP